MKLKSILLFSMTTLFLLFFHKAPMNGRSTPLNNTNLIGAVNKTSDSTQIGEYKLFPTSMGMVKSGNNSSKSFYDEAFCYLKGSPVPDENSELIFHFKTGEIADYIDKAILNIYFKSPDSNVEISIFDSAGEQFNPKELTWKNAPKSGPHQNKFTVQKTSDFQLYSIDISYYIKKLNGNNLTLRMVDESKGNAPIYVKNIHLLKENNISLDIATVSRAQFQLALEKTQAPKYPNSILNKSLYHSWTTQYPTPKDYWVPEIWKQYIAQDGKSRLQDFSYAGYRYGEEKIPDITTILGKVTDFGAIPNDDIDDTANIQKAFDVLGKKKGVILFPKGKYIINSAADNPKKLILNANNIVLRGEGSGRNGTVLFMKNKYLPEQGWGDYILDIGVKSLKEEKPSLLSKSSKRGSHFITVKDTKKYRVGDCIKIALYSEKEKETYSLGLAQTLTYPLSPRIEWSNYGKYKPYENVNQIVAIKGTQIKLKTPLRIDFDLRWKPSIRKVEFYKEVGIENLRFESNWKGPFRHHGSREMDYGWCALNMENIENGWIDNVTFENFTQDISLEHTKNMTVKNIHITGIDGHNGINNSSSWNLLVQDSKITANRIHSIGGHGTMIGSVYSNIDIQTKNGGLIDFHGGGFAMYNLMENISNASVSGAGSVKNMPHSGRENTFWNLEINNRFESVEINDTYKKDSKLNNEVFPGGIYNYANSIAKRGNLSYDCYKLYPASLVVGAHKTNRIVQIGNQTQNRDTEFIYVEGLNRTKIWPHSLYQAQLEFRLNKEKK